MIKVVFIGTPEFSVPILEKLIENKKDYSVVGVVIFFYYVQLR